jgi:nucleoside-diphosphate-sugar epimerase
MKVLVTGSSGTIGAVLRARLSHELTPYDLPDDDARDEQRLVEAAKGHDAIVHLAWDTSRENCLTDELAVDNLVMTHNVYRAALAAGVPRVVMASSVHADDYVEADPHRPLDPYALPTPDSPYGASKCMMEALGRHYAAHHGLAVICVRFGGVSPHDTPPRTTGPERAVWLSHRDCARLVGACLDADVRPGHYEIVTGVGRNARALHSTRNGLGWVPRDREIPRWRRAARVARASLRRLGRPEQ